MFDIQSSRRYILENVKARNSCLDLSRSDHRSSTSPTDQMSIFKDRLLAVIGWTTHPRILRGNRCLHPDILMSSRIKGLATWQVVHSAVLANDILCELHVRRYSTICPMWSLRNLQQIADRTNEIVLKWTTMLHTNSISIDLYNGQCIDFAFQHTSRVRGTSDNMTKRCNPPIFVVR